MKPNKKNDTFRMMMMMMIAMMMVNSAMWYIHHIQSYTILWAYMQTQALYELWDIWYDVGRYKYGIYDVQ